MQDERRCRTVNGFVGLPIRARLRRPRNGYTHVAARERGRRKKNIEDEEEESFCVVRMSFERIKPRLR